MGQIFKDVWHVCALSKESFSFNGPGLKHLKANWDLTMTPYLWVQFGPGPVLPLSIEGSHLYLSSRVFHTHRICVVGSTAPYEERVYLAD